MVKVTVCVPDGKYCGNCRYLRQGTCECMLFDCICEEEYPRMRKCVSCPQGNEFDEPFEWLKALREKMHPDLVFDDCHVLIIENELLAKLDKVLQKAMEK